MAKIGYVILNYMTYQDSINCVNSILAIDGQKTIVVVDNGSTNESYALLLNQYKDISNVFVIRNQNNMGFAKGNNIGINYIMSRDVCDFIVVLNSDTIIMQKKFGCIIEGEYNYSKFDVLGPQIQTADGDISSNPVSTRILDKNEILFLIMKRLIKLLLNYIKLNRFVNDCGVGNYNLEEFNNNKRYENVKLHGACLIFSKKYLEKFEAFDSDTFLYFEEDILYKRIVKYGLKSVYSPKLKIIHLEDGTSKAITNTSREKNIFVLKNEIKSLSILLHK